MKYLRFVKKLIATAVGANLENRIDINGMSNFILALDPLSKDANISGYLIMVMIIAIVILIGYTIVSNKDK